MAYSFLVSGSGGAGTDKRTATTSSMDTTGADLLVAILNFYHIDVVSPATITDSKGNTWSTVLSTVATNYTLRQYVSRPTSVGTAHTVSWGESTDPTYPSLIVFAFSGSVASPADQSTGATKASGTTLATGSVTPTENNEVLVAGAGWDAAATPTIDSGFSTPVQVSAVGAQHVAVAASYKIQTTAGAENPTWSSLNDGEGQANIATYKDGRTPKNTRHRDLGVDLGQDRWGHL